MKKNAGNERNTGKAEERKCRRMGHETETVGAAMAAIAAAKGGRSAGSMPMR